MQSTAGGWFHQESLRRPLMSEITDVGIFVEKSSEYEGIRKRDSNQKADA